MLYTFQELFFSVSAAVYISVNVALAIVRWGHKCEPYARHQDYYFPAWRILVSCFLTSIILLPAVFLPKEVDAHLEVKMMLIMSSPFYCATIIFAYFGKVLQKSGWRTPLHAVAVPFILLMISGCVLALVPDTQLYGTLNRCFFTATGIMSVLCLACFFISLRMIVNALRRFSEENYSNEEDFPRRYAIRVMWIPLAHITISWTAALIGTLPAISVGMLLIAAINVAFLIGALSPHRAKDVSSLEEEREPLVADDSFPQASKEDLVRTIRHYVEDEEAYLDSHLTLASLSRSCGVNRTYVSQVMTERLGGFFTYINHCRLAHAAEIRMKNPEASVEEVAIASGFGSRQSYYNVRRQMGE